MTPPSTARSGPRNPREDLYTYKAYFDAAPYDLSKEEKEQAIVVPPSNARQDTGSKKPAFQNQQAKKKAKKEAKCQEDADFDRALVEDAMLSNAHRAYFDAVPYDPSKEEKEQVIVEHF